MHDTKSDLHRYLDNSNPEPGRYGTRTARVIYNSYGLYQRDLLLALERVPACSKFDHTLVYNEFQEFLLGLYGEYESDILEYLGLDRVEKVKSETYIRRNERVFYQTMKWSVSTKIKIKLTDTTVEAWLLGTNISCNHSPVFRMAQWAPSEIREYVKTNAETSDRPVTEICEEYLESIKLRLLNDTAAFGDGDQAEAHRMMREAEINKLPEIMLWRKILECKQINDLGRSQQ